MSNIDPMLMRQIIMDHYDYPRNKELTKDNGYMSRHMASDSCIDDITVQTKISDGKIDDIRFDGVACTISTASTSIKRKDDRRSKRNYGQLFQND